MTKKKVCALILALLFAVAAVINLPAKTAAAKEQPEAVPAGGLFARTLEVSLKGETLLHVEAAVSSEGENEGFFLTYEMQPIEGARFTIEQLTGGSLVETAETDAEGIAGFYDLAPGIYRITQISSDAEHVAAFAPQEIELAPAGEDAPPVRVEAQNPATGAEIRISAGSAREFGVYAGEDIGNEEGILLIPKDYLIKRLQTDENGELQHFMPLPPGAYYICEEGKKERHAFSVLPGAGGNIIMTLMDSEHWTEHVMQLYLKLARFLSS